MIISNQLILIALLWETINSILDIAFFLDICQILKEVHLILLLILYQRKERRNFYQTIKMLDFINYNQELK
jgi:hypothetical protein